MDLQRMRMITTQRVTIALAATLGIALPISAQISGPTMIPTVLAKAMLGDFGDMMGGIVFVVGKSPDRWPKSFVAPPQARIVGGGKFGPILTTVYEYPSQGDAAASFESQLLKAGFKKAPTAGFRKDGFSSSSGGRPSQGFCGDVGAVGLQQVDSTKTMRTIAMVFISDREASTSCSSRAMQSDPSPLKIPTLRPPVGVNARPGGTGSGLDNVEARVRVDTTLSADEVLAHYVRELVAGGWKAATAPVAGDGVALHQLSARDDKGKEWHGALFIMTSRSEREVTLRMVRDAER